MRPTGSDLEHRQVLDALIEKFTRGALEFTDFEQEYTTYYLDQIPSSALTDNEWEYYTSVHEKIEWTSLAPTSEDRTYGRIGPEDLRKWLSLTAPPSRD